MPEKNKINEVIIITGPSGAGKTTAINILEDIGFEPIDNIPIELIGRLLSGPDLVKPLHLVLILELVDFRQRIYYRL